MDSSMSTFSNLAATIQSARDLLQNGSPWKLIHYLRLSFSTLLTVPMLFSDHPQGRFIALLLSSFAFSVFALTHMFSYQETSVEQSERPSAPALHALSKILIPSSSIWPQTYFDIVRSAEHPASGNCIHIKLETILRDVRQGLIELRDPSSDLPRLIKGQLRMDGWTIKLDIDLKHKTKTWAWAVSEELSVIPDEAFPQPCTFADEGKFSTAEVTVLRHYCSLFYETNNDILLWPSLDAIPSALVQSFIRATQNTIRTKLTSHRTSVFSFTTSDAGLSIFDDAFVCAALPFARSIPKVTKDTRQSSSIHPRSSAPLFARLSDILALLTSGANALRVLSLSNASAPYANALDAHATALEYDDDQRRQTIEAVGVQGWREERLYARWEAASLRAGLLTRWIVLLEMKE